MKKTVKSSKLSAFTLIELLVVIAIMGILASLLFPAIQGALLNAQALRVGNNGRSTVQSIIQTNIELESMSKGSVWPKSANKPTSHNYTTANTYFQWLLGNGYISVPLATFAGGGVPAAPSVDDLGTGDYNIWKVVADMGDAGSDEIPILYTRNLTLTAPDFNDQTTDTKWSDRFDGEKDPFRDKIVVAVTKGAALNSIKKSYLYNQTFLGGVGFTNGTTVVILDTK